MKEIEVVTETIPTALAGQRIDRVVAFVADVSRSDAAALIAAGDATLNGAAPSKPSERVAEGDVVVVSVERSDDQLEPDPSIVIPVVFEDAHVIVVDKPAGLVVHPGAGTLNGTMAHGLLARYPELRGVGPDIRPGIVHRLDKGTSGLLVVARSNEALEILKQQLVVRSMLRQYQTLVDGRVASSEGLIDAPLGRSPRDPTRHAVVLSGRDARTRYEVIERFEEPTVTRLSCRLETGRTHQIRVHLEAIGHPVIGDDRYGGSPPDLGLDRPFLHAATLGFAHPANDEWMEFESPLPADLVDVLSRCRAEPALDRDSPKPAPTDGDE
jgi:23S rRNA pseudouridine1911/1915/1917 synthase